MKEIIELSSIRFLLICLSTFFSWRAKLSVLNSLILACFFFFFWSAALVLSSFLFLLFFGTVFFPYIVPLTMQRDQRPEQRNNYTNA
jgi:predicted membrane protein